MSSKYIMSAEDTEINKNIKYLVVGIDNTTGSFIYISGDDKITDTATKDYAPYDVIENAVGPSNENIQYVKIKVQKSPIKPVVTDKNPSFELNKNWYTLILDQFVNTIETSGVVDKTWFADYGLEKSPFDIFKRFVYTNLVEMNLKYLLNLSQEDSDFMKVFPDVDTNKNGTLEQIQISLVKPFFAVKTILDMKSSKDELINGKQTTVQGYFVNGRDRYGYPNILGDKSHIISALQLLYDIRLYCEECLLDNDSSLMQLHQHVKNRTYFLRQGEPDLNIMDFENKIKPLFATTSPPNLRNECWTFLTGYLNGPSIETSQEITSVLYNRNMLIVDSDQLVQKDKGFEIIGQICKLKDVDQYIYVNYKENLVFNDIEIRKLTEDQRLVQWSEDKRVSLYRKRGETYRDILKSKFDITDDDINLTLKGNQTLIFIDRFLKNNPDEDSKNIDLFMRQYLSDSSRRELDNLLKTPFTGETYRHGICNYNGEISHSIAAMQLVYDCIPRKSKIDYARQQLGTDVITRGFEYQLINIEYCLGRIFENIQVSVEKTYTPLETFVQIPNAGGRENVFYNYMICLNFIINKAKFDFNARFPDSFGPFSDEMITELSSGDKKYGAYKKSIVLNNYFYKVFNYSPPQLRYILANDCVKTIHKIFAVLLTGFNVFIDFDEDLRPLGEKWRNTPSTNFVIKIGSLPRKTAAAPAAATPPAAAATPPAAAATPPAAAAATPAPVRKWLKVSGFTVNEYNGVYEPEGDGYSKIDVTNIKIVNHSTEWEFSSWNSNAATTITSSVIVGTHNVDSKDITIAETDEIYSPTSGSKPISEYTFDDFATTYSGPNSTSYTTVGTIYKSIHHDYYYKYYNHEHKILLSDCNAKYDLQEINLPNYTTNKEMFPFIRLYRRNGYDYNGVNKEDLIYQDVLTWMLHAKSIV